MSELDKLRELLDKAEVSYIDQRTDVTIGYYTEDPHSVIEAMDHSLQVTGLTAEQVMRALGRGTCHMDQLCHEKIAGTDAYCDIYACSECGGDMFEGYNFCPICGRKVMDE